VARKPKSIQSYIDNTVWPIFAKYIRLIWCKKTTGRYTHGICFTCKRLKKFEELQAGHWRGRGNHSTIFDERNVNIQCINCNGWQFLNGNRQAYETELEKLYGREVVDEIMALSKKPKLFTFEELREIRDYYKQKLSELRAK
jgi:hypothetical protein